MDEPREMTILTEVRESQISHNYYAYVESKNMRQINLFTKQKQASKQQQLCLPKGKTGEEVSIRSLGLTHTHYYT